MDKRAKTEGFEPLTRVFGILILLMASLQFQAGVESLFFDTGYKYYVSIPFSLVCFAFSGYILWSHVKILNTLFVVYSIAVIAFCSVSKDKIHLWQVDREYANINQSMIYSYSGIIDTPLYESFLVDKESSNALKIKGYKDNINNYLSVDSAKETELKLLYTSSTNKDVHLRLDDIFKDGVVSKTEYDNFKKLSI